MAFDRNRGAEVDGGRSEVRRIDHSRHVLSLLVDGEASDSRTIPRIIYVG
jgi:hypothetical protein